MIVFDVEIKKGILGRGETPLAGVEYCKGWRDFKNMGVAVVCTFDTCNYLSRIFFEAQLRFEFQAYINGHVTGGFNTRGFDIPLLEEHGVVIDKARHYDLLRELWISRGLNPDRFVPQTHGGWGLDDIMQATFGIGKSGHGALAPVWWQQGHHSRVADYCLRDVWLEATAITHALNGQQLRNQRGETATLPPSPLADDAPLSSEPLSSDIDDDPASKYQGAPIV